LDANRLACRKLGHRLAVYGRPPKRSSVGNQRHLRSRSTQAEHSDDNILARNIADDLVVAAAQPNTASLFGIDQQQTTAEWENLNGNLVAGLEGAEDSLAGMEPPHLDRAAPGEADGCIEFQPADDGFPAQVAQRDEAGCVIATRDGQRAVALRVEDHPFHHDVAISLVQVEDAGQSGELIIAQKPGISVEFRGENQAAIEGLQDQVVIPVIETG
jgi:hypothetical protein